ncbi:MAG: hypothetical protein IBX70_12685 [Clostridia bacterium]|nr:hypothetical protein [Clostridia bacterium]
MKNRRQIMMKVAMFIIATVAFWMIAILVLNGFPSKDREAKSSGGREVIIAPKSGDAAVLEIQNEETPVEEAQPKVDYDFVYSEFLSDSNFSRGFDWSHYELVDLDGDEDKEMVALRGKIASQAFTGGKDYTISERSMGQLIIYDLVDGEVVKKIENPVFSGLGEFKGSQLLYNVYKGGLKHFYRRETFFTTYEGKDYLAVSMHFESDTSILTRLEGYRLSPGGELTSEFNLIYTSIVSSGSEDWRFGNSSISESDYKNKVQKFTESKAPFFVLEDMDPNKFEDGVYEITSLNANLVMGDLSKLPDAPQMVVSVTESESENLVDIDTFLNTGFVSGGVQLGVFTYDEMIDKYGEYKSSYLDEKQSMLETEPIPYYVYDAITFQTSFEAPQGIILTAMMQGFAGISTNGDTHKEYVREILGDRYNEKFRQEFEFYLPPSYTVVQGSKGTLMIGYDENNMVMDLILTTP